MSNQCRIDNFYDKCVYKDCTNSRSHGKRLYRFPLKTDERKDWDWIIVWRAWFKKDLRKKWLKHEEKNKKNKVWVTKIELSSAAC